MELYDFNRNDHVKRAASVFDYGQFLLMRSRIHYQVAFYDMGKFFAVLLNRNFTATTSGQA